MRFQLCGLILVLFVVRAASAGLIEITDAGNWQSTTGPFETIDFTGFPVGTFITDQYQHLGVTFTNVVFIHNAGGYSDGLGLLGLSGVRFVLDTPHHAVAVHHLGDVFFQLLLKGEVVAISSWFNLPGAGVKFSGIFSDQPFDEVYMFVPQPPFSTNTISIDNLYWGAPIPAPGALGMFALAALGSRRRRT